MVTVLAERPLEVAAVPRNPKAVDRPALERAKAILAATCRRDARDTADAAEREHMLDVAALAERA